MVQHRRSAPGDEPGDALNLVALSASMHLVFHLVTLVDRPPCCPQGEAPCGDPAGRSRPGRRTRRTRLQRGRPRRPRGRRPPHGVQPLRLARRDPAGGLRTGAVRHHRPLPRPTWRQHPGRRRQPGLDVRRARVRRPRCRPGSRRSPACTGSSATPTKDDPKAAVLTQTAFARVTERLRARGRPALPRRRPPRRRTARRVAHERHRRHRRALARDDRAPSSTRTALDDWDALLARLVHSVRSGYLAAH